MLRGSHNGERAELELPATLNTLVKISVSVSEALTEELRGRQRSKDKHCENILNSIFELY